MSAERFALDANVLFYAIDSRDPQRHHRAVEIVERAAVAIDCVVPLQALCEFFAAATRKGRLSVGEAAAQVEDWQTLFPLAIAQPATLRRALAAVAGDSLSFWDAMLWAAAREAGVTVLLSEDFQDGRELGGVTFRNPFTAEDPFRPGAG